ncbi:MAG TPA: hypothetical protein VGL10_02945, partial [Gammaproteobacteria bacterium]
MLQIIFLNMSKFALLLLLLQPVIACAEQPQPQPVQLELKGNKTQGGLLIGYTDPGARVQYGEYSLRVSPEGIFIIGFGRDAELKQNITLLRADGASLEQTIELVGRKYEIQKLDGLPDDKVTPPKKEWDRIA